jgi:hypothetical protein
MNRLEESRRDAEARLAQLRGAMSSELGFAPSRKAWLVALLAGAAGVALALRRRGRRSLPGAGSRRKRRLRD